MAAVLNIPDGLGGWYEIPLIQGKSAYQSALDGGYNGSEAQFNLSMSYVDVTGSTQTQLNNKVGTGTTVNGHQLSGNVVVTPTDLGVYTSGQTDTLLNTKTSNGKFLEITSSSVEYNLLPINYGAVLVIGSISQTIKLPDCTSVGMFLNLDFEIINVSSQYVYVYDYSANFIVSIGSGYRCKVKCVDISTPNGTWLNDVKTSPYGIDGSYSYINTLSTSQVFISNSTYTFNTSLSAPNATTGRTITLPNESGELAIKGIDDNFVTDLEKTNINYLTGATSNIQTQINNKVVNAINSGATTTAPSQAAVFNALLLKASVYDSVSKSDLNDQTILSNFVAKNYTRALTTPTELNETYINGFYEITGELGSGGHGWANPTGVLINQMPVQAGSMEVCVNAINGMNPKQIQIIRVDGIVVYYRRFEYSGIISFDDGIGTWQVPAAYEFSNNKSTDSTLGGNTPSDTLYPSQKAVKTALNTRVPYTGATGNVDLGSNSIKTSKVQLKTDAINTLSQGEIGWNSKTLSPEFKANGATIQINQEQNLTIKNVTAGTLLNGRFVRITGYDNVNDYYTVEYSDNSTETTSYVDFMLTEDILSGGIGTGVKNGIVHDLNTAGGTIANVVYLGTNGQFLPTEPSYPSKIVVVGTYGKIDATTGDILVELNKTTQYVTNNILNELVLKAMQNPGICQRCPITANDIVVDTTGLTVTIATIKNGETISPSNPIRFFTDGSGIINKWEKTSPVVFTFTNTSGYWYFYFDNTGTPIATQTVWSDFNTIATIYRIYWNATLTGSERSVAEAWEAHLNDTSAADHTWKHVQGSIWVRGGDTVSNLLTNTNGVPTAPNADGRNVVISLSNTTVSDDGLEYTVKNSTDGLKFSQDLGNLTAANLNATNSALFPIRINTAGGLVYTLPATRFPFPWDVATNRPQYITAAGVRTIVADNRWFVTYVYSLQDPVNGRAIKIVSEVTEFTSYTLAQASSWETLKSSIGTFTDSEIRPLYKLTFYTNFSGGGSYNVGTKYSALVDIDNYRQTRVTTAGTASGSILATSVIVTPTVDLLSTNVQSALEELSIPKVFDGTITGTGTSLLPYSVVDVIGVNSSITYNLDGTVNVITKPNGTKTMGYNPDGTLATITGTGIYKNKTFTYSSGVLQSVVVS